MKTLSIGLIGSGFMGKTHVFGFATAQKVFDLPFPIKLHTLADKYDKTVVRAASKFGFAHATTNWREMLDNPDIDVIDITAPNGLHKEMAPAVQLRVTGSLQGVKCSMTSRFMDQWVPCVLVKKDSTNYIFMHHTMHQVTKSDLTTSKLSKSQNMLAPLPNKARSRFHSEKALGCKSLLKAL